MAAQWVYCCTVLFGMCECPGSVLVNITINSAYRTEGSDGVGLQNMIVFTLHKGSPRIIVYEFHERMKRFENDMNVITRWAMDV